MNKRGTSRVPYSLLFLFVLISAATSCYSEPPHGEKDFEEARNRLVSKLEGEGIRDAGVLHAMRKVERHLFVPEALRLIAYEDRPLPIGSGQTISQPYIVAYMTEALGLKPTDKVLEIGTGSGYQAAVLAQIVKEVYTIEIVEELGKRAAKRLEDLGYKNIQVRIGDGFHGWREQAPFDAIMLTAAPRDVPQPLLDQLAIGGRLILPEGEDYQKLCLVEKTQDGIRSKDLLPVIFVPMTGEAQNQ